MVNVIQAKAGCASHEYKLEDVTIDGAPGTDSGAHPWAAIPNSAIHGEIVQPVVVPTTIRIHLDTERLIKQARNKDEQLAIIAAINRFYTIALLGATDRR